MSNPTLECQPEQIYSISSGSCDVDAAFLESLSTVASRRGGSMRSYSSSLSLNSQTADDLVWRNEILRSLCERNTKELEQCGDEFDVYSTKQVSESPSFALSKADLVGFALCGCQFYQILLLTTRSTRSHIHLGLKRSNMDQTVLSHRNHTKAEQRRLVQLSYL